MNAAVLLTSLMLGGPPDAAAPAPASPAIVRASGYGVFPTPGMGPPGAVAAVGALPNPMVPGVNVPPPAPLVAGKFLVPPGVRVTAFPGSKQLSHMYEAPVVFGMRPGYVFRFELSNLPLLPAGTSLYPEVELRGVLVPRAGMKYMDYPIPLVFTVEDIDRAARGIMITKVIYLEDPDKALPASLQPDFPVETSDNTEAEAIRKAEANGRLMAIVRLGDRKPSGRELITVAVPNTLLLPGIHYLQAPPLPPVFPYFSVPFYDPILGARHPTEECFPNGGDRKEPLGFGKEGQLSGLNVTDVGVEYTVNGKRRVTTSNIERICAPRFLIRRAEIVPGGLENRQVIAGNLGIEASGLYQERVAPMADIGREKANQYVGRMRPAIYLGKVGISIFIGANRPTVIGQVEGVKVEGALVEPEVLTAYPSLGPLTVTKRIDPPGPKQQGDVVTITIRFANTGLKTITDLVVSDSLSGRLEYIAGSAETDRAANFSMSENEAGSAIVRWELPGELYPGQAGTIKFKARVR